VVRDAGVPEDRKTRIPEGMKAGRQEGRYSEVAGIEGSGCPGNPLFRKKIEA